MNASARPMGPAGDSLALPLIGKSTSRVGFGTGGLLRIGSSRRRQDTLAAALANGVTHFDTAPLYGFGESERALGQFLRGRRHKITLTTKFGLQASPLAARLAVSPAAGARCLEVISSPAQSGGPQFGRPLQTTELLAGRSRASLEKSLRALRTDHVDFYLAHQVSAVALPNEELLGWLEDVQRAGKILAFGVATDFDWLLPVLRARPMLARVVQFDNDLLRQNAASIVVRAGY